MPSQFLEERLPIGVRLGASEDDDFAVEVTTTASGSEYRRLIHGMPMRTWTIKFTSFRVGLLAQVKSLFWRSYGRYGGFRVKCLDDFTTHADGVSAYTALDHPLTRISSGVYQLSKRYGVGGTALDVGLPTRVIYKPVAGKLLVAKNTVTILSGVSLDTTTGLVTITPAPLVGDQITAGCEFDIPARFNSPIHISSLGADVRDTGEFEILELLSP